MEDRPARPWSTLTLPGGPDAARRCGAGGHQPPPAALNLQAAGVELTERGAVKTDERMRTTAPNIWAMGDVAGGLQFTYISLDDFRIVKASLLGDGSRTTENRGAVPYSVFLDPPFSRVGLTEAEARRRATGWDRAAGGGRLSRKRRCCKKPVGLLKAVIDADTGHILGAHLFCEESHDD